jgi:hypothetical protein
MSPWPNSVPFTLALRIATGTFGSFDVRGYRESLSRGVRTYGQRTRAQRDLLAHCGGDDPPFTHCSKPTRHLLLCVPADLKAPQSVRLELAVWDSEQTPVLGSEHNCVCSTGFTVGDLCYAAYETWSTTPLAPPMA